MLIDHCEGENTVMLVTSRLVLPLILGILSASVCGQDSTSLNDVVRDQYVQAIDKSTLEQIANDKSLSGLDKYSHFMTAQELHDVSQSSESAAFSRVLKPECLYLRIPVFHIRTSSQVHTALAGRLQQATISCIIIDLRGNRGGLLNAAIEVADEFVKDGVLATTKGR